MTPDEMVKIKNAMNKVWKNHKLEDGVEILTILDFCKSALKELQDYQKLRERVSVEKISGVIHDTEDKLKIKKLGYITFIDKGGNKIVRSFENFIADAIVTYLQQPTEHWKGERDEMSSL